MRLLMTRDALTYSRPLHVHQMYVRLIKAKYSPDITLISRHSCVGIGEFLSCIRLIRPLDPLRLSMNHLTKQFANQSVSETVYNEAFMQMTLRLCRS